MDGISWPVGSEGKTLTVVGGPYGHSCFTGGVIVMSQTTARAGSTIDADCFLVAQESRRAEALSSAFPPVR